MIYTSNLFEELLGRQREIKNLDESMKYFFPSLWNAILGDIESIFPIITDIDKEDTDYLNSKTTGIDFKVYLNNDINPNAWTFPGISNVLYVQLLHVPIANLVVVFSTIIRQMLEKINFNVKNDKINFISKINNAIMWETKGLKSIVQDKDIRFSIMLHEIGHWVKFEAGLIATLIRPLIAIPLLNYIFIIIIIALIRSNEKQADRFVKEVGYGNQLAEALDIIGYANIRDVSINVKLNRMINIIFVKIHDVIDKYIPLSTHPSIKTRISNLSDNYINIYGNNIIYENMIMDTIAPLIKKLISPIDSLLADNKWIFTRSS